MAAPFALGACSVDRLSEMVPSPPRFSNFEWNPYSKASTTIAPLTRVTVTPADYVNADGSCAGASPDSQSTEGMAAEGAVAEQPPPRVALQMTECAVVKALGPPEKIDIGANERGDRTATLLYSRGERRGLYHFTAGQLTLIERVAEPEPPPKQKPAPTKPRRAVT